MPQFFYDVFISHAYEDQNEFASKLAFALKQNGLTVWYSGFELTLGTSIIASVNQALCESKYVIVVISPVYLTKAWAMKELKNLFGGATERKRILPVLHGISIASLKKKLNLSDDHHAVSSRIGVDHVVDRVMQEVKGKKSPSLKQPASKTKKKSPRKKTGTNAYTPNIGVIVLGGKAGVENAMSGNIVIRKSKK